MNYRHHQRVQRDIDEAVAHYEEEAGPKIADEFFSELLDLIDAAGENPRHFHFSDKPRGYRRANLKRFPYHFIYKEFPGFIYILVVKHDNRRPNYGLRREIRITPRKLRPKDG